MPQEYEAVPQRPSDVFLSSSNVSTTFGKKEKFVNATKTPHKDFDFKRTEHNMHPSLITCISSRIIGN